MVDKNQIISKQLINRKYQSPPLVAYEERHGGPLWFDISVITLLFKKNNTIEITIDKSMSKKMTINQHTMVHKKGKYELVVVLPEFISGNIQLEDSQSFYFECIHSHFDYLYLERPPIWKESLVVKRQI